MKILISNDDGIDSPGLSALADAFRDLGEVTVVAPHRERSTAGHSLTLHKPLRLHDYGNRKFSASGTPADCIYLGIHYILKEKPDLILSGINNGANLGTDIHYSGTVAAAREAALMNIPAYAFSMVDLKTIVPGAKRDPFRFPMAAQFARRIVLGTRGIEFPKHTLLNVNVPNIEENEIRGIKISRQGFRHYSTEVARGLDPRGKEYFWIGGAYRGFEESPDSDCRTVEDRYVSVVPLTIDCTHNGFYTTLKGTASIS